VRVEQGVVFLSGSTREDDHRDWALRLAANTQDVVAVVNEIAVTEPSVWDLSPAIDELRAMGSSAVRRAPMFAIGALLLIATLVSARWSMRGASSLLRGRVKSRLLREVGARVVAIPVFLLGLYIVLSVSGLTGLAVTVIGGTGLIGLIIGFAFRDIAENFLASILISIQRPFATNDLIEVAGHKGFVQSVNPRSTLLLTLEGNHVQVPNATIYKETIVNFTANPRSRHDFAIGIGYDDSIAKAQSVALDVLTNHPAVLDDPEPLVLVESLGAATVNLRLYFWVDITRYSHMKVKSAVIRLTKRALSEAEISLPDESREVIFPRPVPVRMISEEQAEQAEHGTRPRTRGQAPESSGVVHTAEGDLENEAADMERQARTARSPEGGTDLLK
jgi:small conductance mechanosensitive channel